MTDEHPYAKLRKYERTIAGLMADPEVTGDLLLVGLWLARATILGQPEPRGGGWHYEDMARDLFPLHTTPAMVGLGEARAPAVEPNAWKVVAALKADIRRYDLWADQPDSSARWRCGGPMQRRVTPCGKSSTIAVVLTDPATGRRRVCATCRSHRPWFDEQLATNRAALEGVEVPRPPANAGGRLAPHIRELDWPGVYRAIDKDWQQPPEVDSWARPDLTVLVTPRGTRDSLTAAVQPPGKPRPRFTVIGGGVS